MCLSMKVCRMKEAELLAQRILHLEQQIESYARLHAEELAEMRKVLQSLKDELLVLYQQHRASYGPAVDSNRNAQS